MLPSWLRDDAEADGDLDEAAAVVARETEVVGCNSVDPEAREGVDGRLAVLFVGMKQAPGTGSSAALDAARSDRL